MKFFKPDFHLDQFADITPEWLQTHQIKTVFSDLDSTLAIHDQPADQELKQWIFMLKDQGVQLVVVSNNSQGRVEQFCKPFDIKGFGDCKKPVTSRIKEHMQSVGADKSTSLFLGDQLLTDIWCGKLLDLRTALVKPIGREHEPVQVVLKRKLETLIKKQW